MFQFHIGSIQALCVGGDFDCLFYVSIPHWFDSSSRRVSPLSYLLSVSIPHWFDSSTEILRDEKGEICVSIPHWFDSSPRVCGHTYCAINLFQFHIGSIQALDDGGGGISHRRFQFHIGSIQANPKSLMYRLTKLFQFHIGSIQALLTIALWTQQCAVSIPHWFDSSLPITSPPFYS